MPTDHGEGCDLRDADREPRRVALEAYKGVMQSLLQSERGGHRAAGKPFQVRPVVVIWGAWKENVPPGAHLEGVEFVGGGELVSWLRTLDGETVASDAAEDLLRRLEAFRATAWSAVPRRWSASPRGRRGCRCPV